MSARIRGEEKSRGQALVEFALVMPFFVLVLFGIIDLGRYVYSTNSFNEVVRESARFGSVSLRPSECAALTRDDCVKALARNRLVGVQLATGDVTVVCQRISGSGALPADPMTYNCTNGWRSNDLMRVRAERNFTLVTPVIGQLIGNLHITAEALVTVNG